MEAAEGALAAYDAAIRSLAPDGQVETGRMFGTDCLKVHGKVFGMLHHDRLVVKLPAARVASLIEAGDGAPFDPGHGRVMREWVSIDRFAAASWSDFLCEAHAFVLSLASMRET